MAKKSPNFEMCIQMMRKRNPQTAEDGFHFLVPLVDDYLDHLNEEIGKPENDTIRVWLLELIGFSSSDAAVQILTGYLHSEDKALRDQAILSLKAAGRMKD